MGSSHNIRLTTHPGPFTQLASTNDIVLQNSIADLELHGLLFDLMGLSRTPYNKINIHVGKSVKNFHDVATCFASGFSKLSESVYTRLTLENDDKENGWSVSDLMQLRTIDACSNIPLVYDLHHALFTSKTTVNDLLYCMSTWPDNIVPSIHYSESKSLHENNLKIRATAHSDYIHALPELSKYNLTLDTQLVDVMVEAKMKEQAILPFL